MPPTEAAPRSLMLVTGGSEALLEAAFVSGAEMVCLDFEDTVTDKAAAHRLVPRLLSAPSPARRAIRINPIGEAAGLEDLLRVRDLPQRPAWIKLTKVEDPFEVRLAATVLPGVRFMAIIETAVALERAADIARSSPALAGLILGGKDLSKSLGCARSWNGLLYARGRVAHAAALAGVAAIDEPYRPLEDLQGLADTCRRVREMGYVGKTVLTPEQVPVVNAGFGG